MKVKNISGRHHIISHHSLAPGEEVEMHEEVMPQIQHLLLVGELQITGDEAKAVEEPKEELKSKKKSK